MIEYEKVNDGDLPLENSEMMKFNMIFTGPIENNKYKYESWRVTLMSLTMLWSFANMIDSMACNNKNSEVLLSVFQLMNNIDQFIMLILIFGMFWEDGSIIHQTWRGKIYITEWLIFIFNVAIGVYSTSRAPQASYNCSSPFHIIITIFIIPREILSAVFLMNISNSLNDLISRVRRREHISIQAVINYKNRFSLLFGLIISCTLTLCSIILFIITIFTEYHDILHDKQPIDLIYYMLKIIQPMINNILCLRLVESLFNEVKDWANRVRDENLSNYRMMEDLIIRNNYFNYLRKIHYWAQSIGALCSIGLSIWKYTGGD